MPKAVIPVQLDVPEGHPLLSSNAMEAQMALARVETAIDDALSEALGAPADAIAIWTYPGTHRHTTTDPA